MRISAPRALLGLVLLLCLGPVGPAPAALARSAEVATTTSVVLSTSRPQTISVAIAVTAADGSDPDGVVDVVIREVDGTFEGDYGRYAVQGETVRQNFSVPRQGTYEVEARYTPSSSPTATTYAASVGTSTITLTDVPPELFLRAGDIGNGVLEVAASVTAFGGARVEDGSFVLRLAGRAPVTLANRRGGVVYGYFEELPLDRSYTVEAQFRPAAGSDVQPVSGSSTTRLTQVRHKTFIGATGRSPRRGVVRIAAFMIETYPKGLVGAVAIRDQRTGDVVARIATMRYADVVPGVVRTVTGVSRGVHRYVLTFTPARQFRATTASSTSRPLRIEVR